MKAGLEEGYHGGVCPETLLGCQCLDFQAMCTLDLPWVYS